MKQNKEEMGSKKVSKLQKTIIVVNLLLLGLLFGALNNFKMPNLAMAQEQKVALSETGFTNYAAEKLSDKKTNILFFNAAWCPHCKATVENIRSEKDSLDKNLNILSIDPDAKENADLMAKYQVTGFPTFVKVDKNGNEVEKWSGETTVSELNSKK